MKAWIKYSAVAVLCIAAVLYFVRFEQLVPATTIDADNASTVKAVQAKLTQLGYDPGPVDGVFGSKTEEAVKSFQRDRGLTPDGIVGPQTLEAMGLTEKQALEGISQLSEKDLDLLIRIINAEARGEPFEGQVAVGEVVLNRVASPAFPDTIEGVIFQEGAFTAVKDGQFQVPVTDPEIRKAALEALNGSAPTKGAVYYYNPVKTTNKWIYTRPVLTRIGEHVFAR